MALQESGLALAAVGAGQYIADLDKAERATSDFLGGLGEAESSAGKFTGAISGAAGAAAAFGGAAVVGAIGAVGTALFEASEQAAAIRNVLGQDLGTEELTAVAGAAGLLEQRFGADLQGQIGAARQLVANGLAPDFASAMDIITAGFENGLNAGDDLLDTLTEYSGNFASLGFAGDEVLTLINRGLEAGARNSDVLGDAVKEFGILIREPGTVEAVRALDDETANLVQAFQEGKISGEEAFNLIGESLNGIQDPIQRNALGVQLFGTLWEDVGDKAILAMTQASDGAIESAGASEQAGERIASLGEIFPRIWGAATTALLPANDAVLGFINTILGADDPVAAFGAQLQELGAQAIGAIQEALPGWQAGLSEMAGKLGTWVQEGLPAMLGSLADARTRLVSWALDSLPEWAGGLAQLGAAAGQWVVDALPGLGTNLGQITALLITKTGEFISMAGPKLLELGGRFVMWVAEEVLPNLPAQLASVAQALVTGIGNFLTEIGPPLQGVAVAFLEWVAEEVLPALPGEMAKIGTALANGITTFAGEVVGRASDLGQSLIDGIAQGARDAASSLYSAISNIIQSALGAGEQTAEKGSPSRLFARELGEPISQGIAVGVWSQIAMVEDAISGVVLAGVDAGAIAAPGMGTSIGQGFAQGLNAQAPTVTQAAQKLAQAALGGAQLLLDIGRGGSPSGVFFDVGTQVDEGLAEGIEGALGLASAAGGTLADAVQEGAIGVADAMPGLGREVPAGLAEGIQRGADVALSAAAKLAAGVSSAAKAELKIASPSLEFEDIGADVDRGMARGILNNVDVLLDAAKEISWAVLDEAKAFAATIQDAVAPLFKAAFQGAADLARGQISALDALDDLAPDGTELERRGQAVAKVIDQLNNLPSEYADKRAKLEAEIAKLEQGVARDDQSALRKRLEEELKTLEGGAKEADRRAQLAYTAANNFDPEKRRQAQQELDELNATSASDSPRAAAIRDQLAGLDRGDAQAEAAARQAELDRIRGLRQELDGLAAAEAQRRAELKADADLGVARYQEEEARYNALQAIQDKAQRDILAVQDQAATITDVDERAQFEQLRTKQILEDAKLRQRLALAEDETERNRLMQRLGLLRTAQRNELQLYQQEAKERQSATAAALRDAQNAAKQLGNLVYHSQQDVYGQGEDAVRSFAAGMLAQLQALQGQVGAPLLGALGGVTMPSPSLPAPASVYAPAAPNYSYSYGGGSSTVINLDLRGVAAADVGAIEAAVKRALTDVGVRADTYQRMK